MSDNDGNFKADIPDDAIAAALRSVERGGRPGDEGGGEGEAGEGAEEVRGLKALLEDSTARARQTQERLKETHERYLRVAADFENWKKRAHREKDEAVKYGSERLLKDFLPVVDNLERALASSGEAEALREGVRLVHKQFVDTLGRHGVTGFSAVGEPFDPSKHEALMQQETSEVPPNTVVSEMAKGYLLHDRLVRPAAVVVAKAPSGEGQAG
jgi:molecular chaperone GrpE